MMRPQGSVHETEIWQGEQRQFLHAEQIRQVALFLFLYLLVFFTGSAVMMGYGYSLQESLFEFASSLGTVGLSVGVTAAAAPVGLLWTQTVGMFLGRLEFFTVFVGIACLLRDIRPMLTSQPKKVS